LFRFVRTSLSIPEIFTHVFVSHQTDSVQLGRPWAWHGPDHVLLWPSLPTMGLKHREGPSDARVRKLAFSGPLVGCRTQPLLSRARAGRGGFHAYNYPPGPCYHGMAWPVDGDEGPLVARACTAALPRSRILRGADKRAGLADFFLLQAAAGTRS